MISLRSYILQILSLRSLALAGYTSTPKGGLIRSEHFAAPPPKPLEESEFPNELLPSHYPSPPQAPQA